MLGTTFPAVLDDARTGDPVAWGLLLDDIGGPLLGFARGRGVEDPDDVFGETLLHVVRGLDGFTGDEQGFRAWVFTIAHRRVVDAQRRHHRRPSTPMPDDELVPLAEALDAGADELEMLVDRLHDAGRIDALLAHLTDEQREVLVLRFFADLDATTVGEVTGRSVNAVAAITRRALRRLEEVVETGRADRVVPSSERDASPDDVQGR